MIAALHTGNQEQFFRLAAADPFLGCQMEVDARLFGHCDHLMRFFVCEQGALEIKGDTAYLTGAADGAELAGMLAAHIDLSTATVSGPCPESIRRVAYCTGSGSSLLEEARAAGADIFITGDVKYHTALDTQLCLFDVGHHSLEEEMMRRAAIHLQHACPMLEVVFVPSASPFQPVHPRVL